jgi:hypothetical protein
MKRTLGLFLLAAAALSVGCHDDTSSNAGQGRLRIVNVSPDAPSLALVVDGDTVASDVAYLGSSDYIQVPATGHVFQVADANASATLIDQDVTVADGVDYTVLVRDTLADIKASVLTDDNGPPPAGTIRVRAIHGAPSLAHVDIYVTEPDADLTLTTPTASNIAFGDVLPYVNPNSGTYEIRVTATGFKDVLIDGSFTVESSQVRTVIAVDAAGGGGPFDLLVLNDRD